MIILCMVYINQLFKKHIINYGKNERRFLEWWNWPGNFLRS